MQPRPTMVCIGVNETPRKALELVISEGYSKLPVYEETIDNIIGAVYERELLIALANGNIANVALRSIMRKVAVVPENKKVADLLRDMKRDQFSLAIVLDEYGGTAGLVTDEDILEEIVGEIRDENDQGEEEPIRLLDPSEAIVDARVNIEDVNAELGTHLPHEEFETIGGYLVGSLGHFPHEGEEMTTGDGVKLRVERMRNRRILSIRVKLNGRAHSQEESLEADAHSI
jgi:putative hemolysin